MASSSSSSSSSPANPSPSLDTAHVFTSPPLHVTLLHQELLGKQAKRRARQRALRMSREKQIPSLVLRCTASQFPSQPCFNENPHSVCKEEGDHLNEDGKFRQSPCFNESSPSAYKEEGVYLNENGKFQQFFFQEGSAPSDSGSLAGGLVIYDGKVVKNRAEEDTSDCTGRDGDVSEVGSDRGPDLFELRNWRNGASSSPSSSSSNSSYELPLNVTRAVSECSSDEHTLAEFGCSVKIDDDGNGEEGDIMHDGLSTEYWKLQADVLAAECNLLRVEKELALRRWHQGRARNDAQVSQQGRKKDDALENAWRLRRHAKHCYYEDEAKEPLQDTSDSEHGDKNCFAREALRKLDVISNTSSRRRVPVEDPTEALQERLQHLLLNAQSPLHEKESQVHSFMNLRSYDAWDKADMLGVRARTVDKRATRESKLNNKSCVEACTLKKQQDGMPMELLETKATAAFIRREYQSMLSVEDGLLFDRSAQEMLGDDIYCRAAIRHMVAQMQAESEQWSQVQEILLSLQQEMGVLIEARELWEKRAFQAEAEVASLEEMMHDWRCRAQSAEDEVALLRSERQALKSKIHSLKQKYAIDRRRWNEAGGRPNDGVRLPIPNSQPRIGSVCEVEEQPRHASVGTQEDYALCESIVHSRNESSRSSVDFGITSQRSFQKSSKKSLDFSNSSNDGNMTKSRVRGHRLSDQILKIEPTRLDFCSKTSDVNDNARHKLSGSLSKVELTRLECVESASASEQKERKKARRFTSKENYSKSGPLDAQVCVFADTFVQKGSLGQALSIGQDAEKHKILSKPKSSVPSAPTSTPSRLPFAEIFNSPVSR